MRIEQEFLHDILENHDDDAPRLIYADWLDDNGRTERADFIRVQCELARIDRYDRRWLGLWNRQWELRRAHETGWIDEIGLIDLDEPRFRRGFLEHAAFTDCLEYLAQAGRLLQRVPLSSATFGALGGEDSETGRSVGLRQLLRSKYVRPLRRVEFHTDDEFARADIAQLARLPSGACLEELDLSCSNLTNGDIEALTRCPTVARLRSLKLMSNQFDATGIHHLATCPHLKGLCELDLHGEFWPVDGEGLQALVSSPYLTSLRELSLSYRLPSGDGMGLLAHWQGLASLVRLDLRGNSLGAVDEGESDRLGLRELVESPYWKDLRELDLSDRTMDDLETLEMFLALPKITSLRVLRLGEFGDRRGNQQDEAARLVARAPLLDGLNELYIDGYSLTDRGRNALRERFGERLVASG
jgi:uncharacterized protein (TIGR02996 family)